MTENFEIIESYFEGKMTLKEKRDFEEKLLNSGFLQEEFELYKSLRKGISSVYEEQAIKSILKRKEKQIQQKESKKKYYTYTAIAAILLLSIGVVLQFNSDNYKMNKLADEYYVKTEPLPVLMGEKENGIEIQFSKVMQSYSRGEYEESIKLLSKLPISDTTQFYTAICKLELGENPVNDFNKIDEESEFYEKSSYYLFLFYLKSNNLEAAKKQFTILKTLDNHPYSDKIEALKSESFIKNKLETNIN